MAKKDLNTCLIEGVVMDDVRFKEAGNGAKFLTFVIDNIKEVGKSRRQIVTKIMAYVWGEKALELRDRLGIGTHVVCQGEWEVRVNRNPETGKKIYAAVLLVEQISVGGSALVEIFEDTKETVDMIYDGFEDYMSEVLDNGTK